LRVTDTASVGGFRAGFSVGVGVKKVVRVVDKKSMLVKKKALRMQVLFSLSE
jgi:hypothetical protein